MYEAKEKLKEDIRHLEDHAALEKVEAFMLGMQAQERVEAEAKDEPLASEHQPVIRKS